MSYIRKNGYVQGALLFLPQIKKLRETLEFEKFQCRVLKDDERTQEFKKKTEELKDSIYAFRYNNIESEKMTEAGKKYESKGT
ncbi:MAG: hypothetical protein M0R17_05430 [Candidatus Omnitrophica bacterium]|jgi:hypothetical protein|nr:hypothetical protein [Candidatus Omnitrophota bacterium]